MLFFSIMIKPVCMCVAEAGHFTTAVGPWQLERTGMPWLRDKTGQRGASCVGSPVMRLGTPGRVMHCDSVCGSEKVQVGLRGETRARVGGEKPGLSGHS
jgi:hypothetical protein